MQIGHAHFLLPAGVHSLREEPIRLSLKTLGLSLASIGLGLAGALVAAELLLPAIGYPQRAPLHSNEPTMLEPHAIRGWRNKAARYEYPAYDIAGSPISMTILSDGQRRTATNPLLYASLPKIVIVGGSFVQGWGISDADTFAWKLQARFGRYEIMNFGTAGYGTYQTLLLLEELLPKLSEVRLVIYAYYDDHDVRNVGSSGWLAALSRYRRRGHVQVPFVRLEDGRLHRYPPTRYQGLPWHQQSAVVGLLDDVLIRIRDRNVLPTAAEVTHRLIDQIHQQTNRQNAQFATVVLSASPDRSKSLSAFTAQAGISLFDCHIDRTPEYRIAGEGHPNEKLNTLWGNCMTASITKLLSR